MIKEYYKAYMNSKSQFKKFHNEVINMPRDRHTGLNLKKLQSLASYLLLIPEQDINNNEGINYKEILREMNNKYIIGSRPKEEFRDKYFEETYLGFNPSQLEEVYSEKGRMFRHNMAFTQFFGMLKSISRQKKMIQYEKCYEYITAYTEIEKELIRNDILSVNIKTNSYIHELKGINLKYGADYSPAEGIIKYIYQIKRPVTEFEIAILLGRIDDRQSLEEILERAIDIGQVLGNRSQRDQIELFFKELGWLDEEGTLFNYKASQEPHFKFRAFIEFACDFELLIYNKTTQKYTLSVYSEKIIKEELPPELIDLENLLSKIENTNIGDAEIKNLIVRDRSKMIMNYIRNHSEDEFLFKLGRRSIKQSEKIKERKRNPLIMELSKLLNNHTCHVVTYIDENDSIRHDFDKNLFKNSKGISYCEGHHIIEFNRENGPDIVENILLVDPNTHMLIHHANEGYRNDLYAQIKAKGLITVELFEKMITRYNCLTYSHVYILRQKGLLHKHEEEKLYNLIEKMKVS